MTDPMTMRTTETTVTFNRSFNLCALDERQPAGSYRLTIDEEQIIGISFLAYRRVATMLETPAIGSVRGPKRRYEIDRDDLEAAIEQDRRACAPEAGFDAPPPPRRP